jgi:hypothetical protein
MPKTIWEADVHKMINVYKASGDEPDLGSIVKQLTKLKLHALT